MSTSPLTGLATKINKAFGNIFLDAVLTRSTPGNGPAYDPGDPTLTTYDCKAIADSYSSYAMANSLVNSNDMQVSILAGSLSVDPLPLDKIEITSQGFVGFIVAGTTSGVKAVQTDPAKAVWQCRCSI